MSSASKEDQAIEIIAPRKFHRLFTAPATDVHGPLKVSYSIAGVDVDEGDDVPTILFCGGMFGTRWQALFLNWIAETEGVRILFLDRPGFGGSTEVPLNERIATVLEIIPLLLDHLKIEHVALASQSAGTIYALNILLHYPELLYPANPSITFFSPWVHQSHTSVSFLTLASMLPNTLLNHWNKVLSFTISSVAPTIAFSGGVSAAVVAPFKDKVKTQMQKEEEKRKCLDGYGITLELKEVVDATFFKFAFAENTTGLNDEARLCLKSVGGISWDACDNYEEYVRTLAEFWDKRIEDGSKPLRVDIFLPEEDVMVGEKGMKYFEECWKEESRGNGIKVECVRWKGTDHDSTTSPPGGAIGRMFSVVKGLRASDWMME